LRLSILLASQGEFDRAKDQVAEVLRQDPDNKAARQILGRIEYLDRRSKSP
jgi:Tfp pilus assembly protein PilF